MHIMKNIFIRALFWFLASVVTAALATTLSTQFVIAALADIGANVDFAKRLSMTWADLRGLAPLYFVFLGLGLVIAFLAAGGLYRLVKKLRSVIFIVAGAVAVAVTLILMEKVFFDVPLIAGARSGFGFFMQMIAGAVGGFVFARLTQNLGKQI